MEISYHTRRMRKNGSEIKKISGICLVATVSLSKAIILQSKKLDCTGALFLRCFYTFFHDFEFSKLDELVKTKWVLSFIIGLEMSLVVFQMLSEPKLPERPKFKFQEEFQNFISKKFGQNKMFLKWFS